jgi:hypothetical protein
MLIADEHYRVTAVAQGSAPLLHCTQLASTECAQPPEALEAGECWLAGARQRTRWGASRGLAVLPRVMAPETCAQVPDPCKLTLLQSL